MVAFTGGGSYRGGYRITWKTKRFQNAIDAAITEAMHSVAEQAKQYWYNEEWTPERHPEMSESGGERDQGYFRVKVTPGKRSRLIVGSSSPHSINEEFGNVASGSNKRPGHHPLRRTLDVIAPKVSPALRKALKTRLGK